MALLSFPPSPFNGQQYPSAPLPGQNVYEWSSTEQTWRLLGPATGVSAGTYGDSFQVGEFTVDATGRITAAENVPIRTATTLQTGLVQVGSNLDITPLGVLSVPLATTTIPGVVVVGSNINVSGAGIISVPVGSTTTPGVVSIGTNIQVSGSGQISVPTATAVTQGVIRIGANLNISPAGVVSVPNASTTVRGATLLVNNTTTNDPTAALTAAAGFDLQAQIDELETNLRFCGTLNASTGLMASVTPDGTASGFVVGSPLPTPTAARERCFVIVSVAGTFTPTGSGSSVNALVGSWFICLGSVWNYVPVGPEVPSFSFFQFDDISGGFDGIATDFPLEIGGVAAPPTPTSNIMVFLGSVPQIPGIGNAYTVSGSTITFTAPPLAGTTFYATTVGIV